MLFCTSTCACILVRAHTRKAFNNKKRFIIKFPDSTEDRLLGALWQSKLLPLLVNWILPCGLGALTTSHITYTEGPAVHLAKISLIG